MLNEFLSKVLMALAPVVALLITYLITLLIQYLKTVVKNKILWNALDQLDLSAKAVVKEMNQTVVDALKEAAKDGKLTKEEMGAAKARALARLIQVAPNEAMNIVEQATGDLTARLEAMIEAAIADTKK